MKHIFIIFALALLASTILIGQNAQYQELNTIKRTIEKERYMNTTFFYEWEDGDTLAFNQEKIGKGAYFYNYNKNISIDELQQLVRTRYCSAPPVSLQCFGFISPYLFQSILDKYIVNF